MADRLASVEESRSDAQDDPGLARFQAVGHLGLLDALDALAMAKFLEEVHQERLDVQRLEVDLDQAKYPPEAHHQGAHRLHCKSVRQR